MIIIDNNINVSNIQGGEFFVNKIDMNMFYFDIENCDNYHYEISPSEWNAAVLLVNKKLYDSLSEITSLCIGDTHLEKSYIITEDMYEDFYEKIMNCSPSRMVTIEDLINRSSVKTSIIHTNKKKYLEFKLLYES